MFYVVTSHLLNEYDDDDGEYNVCDIISVLPATVTTSKSAQHHNFSYGLLTICR